MLEAELRDELANRLDLIEPGLKLVDVEYPLPNSSGTMGRIDILARDRFEHFVVIEVKRSNAVARAALHELYKYAELLRAERGVDSQSIRCMIVSTEWTELIRPFSALVRSFDYPVEGHLVNTDSSGHITSLERIQPLEAPGDVKLTNEHRIYLFASPELRDAAFDHLARALSEVGAPNAVALMLNPDEQMLDYGYSHLLYLALGSVDSSELSRLKQQDAVPRRKGISPQNIAFELSYARVRAEIGAEDYEASDSQKFIPLVASESNWKVMGVRRAGVFALQRDIISDDEIIRAMSGRSGSSTTLVELRASPRLLPSWKKLTDSADRLLGNADDWRDGVRLWLEAAKSDGVAEAYFAAYTPHNFPQSLIDMRETGGLEGWPWLNAASFALPQKLVTDSAPSRLLQGRLVWDGTTNVTMLEAFKSVYGSSFNWGLYFNPVDDNRLLGLLGLRHALFERDLDRRVWLLEVVDGGLVRRPHDDVAVDDRVTLTWRGSLPFEDFVSRRSEEVAQLIEFAVRERVATIE